MTRFPVLFYPAAIEVGGLEPLSRRVALGSPSQSLGEDAQTECQETPRKPRKRLRLTRSREKMDSALAGSLALNPGDAGGSGAIHQSSVDAADVDRTGQRDYF